MKKLFIAAALAATCMFGAAGVAAAAPVLDATGAGWCSSDYGGYCNSDGGAGINNVFAGSGDIYRDWFSFDIPTLTITSATLSVWNDYRNSGSSGQYDIYAASDFSFAGFLNGLSLGHISAAAINSHDSSYVNVALNSDGLAALSAAQGTSFRFGGVTSGGVYEVFGYTSGYPAAYLTLNSSAPEPAIWAAMILGFFGAGSVLRRTRRAVAV